MSPALREFPPHPLAGVGAVVVWNGRVLLVERSQPPLAGLWTLPGGLIELGESAREAAIREVREETGLEVEIGDVTAVVDYIERDPEGRVRYHYLIADFTARPRNPAAELMPSSDSRRARWVARAEWEHLQLTPGLAEILARLLP